jgi:D-alanyl-D-alanine carboxypeptidase/D-alanyl-D-alanine carboxypeptidase (penicillin-binding protein 5/6)
LNYGFEEYPRFVMCTADRDFRRIPVGGSLVRFVAVRTLDSVAYPLSLTEQVRAKVSLPDLVEAPVTEGTIAGKLTFYLGDEPVGETYLVYSASVARNVVASNNLLRKVLDFFRHREETTFLDAFQIQ